MPENNDEKVLEDVLEDQAEAATEEAMERAVQAMEAAMTPAPPTPEVKTDSENHTQWAVGGNGRFSPVGATTNKMPSGVYEPFVTPTSWGLERMNITSDGIYELPDMATKEVLSEVKKFWLSEDKYRSHNLLYKRGLILFGPPGGGKTVCIKLLMNELVERGGVVVLARQIPLTLLCLKAIRRVEPLRNLIVVLEDIDEIIRYQGEATVLSMLDGEDNIDRVVNLASTNFPDRLGSRIINRPSRFDRRIEVGMPSDESRRFYLSKATKDGLSADQMEQWVTDTKDLSIAHLRELVAAVYCLEQPYKEVIDRLKEMQLAVKSEEEFKRGKVGFASPRSGFVSSAPTPAAVRGGF